LVKTWQPQGATFNNGTGQIQIDNQGLFWEVDSTGYVQVFDPNGNYLTKIIGTGSNPGQVSSQGGISLDGNGGLYEVDTNYKAVHYVPCNLISSPTATPTTAPTICETEAVQWNANNYGPIAVYADNQPYGKIFVSTNLGINIQGIAVYSPGGNLLFNINSPYFAAFTGPAGMAIDPVAGELYVVNVSAGYVSVFDLNGNWRRNIGNNILNQPSNVALDGKGNVYVGDGHLFKLTTTGSLVWTFKGQGNTVQASQVGPVAVGPDGNIYCGNGTLITVISPSGQYIRQFGSQGSGFGQFNGISSMQFDANGYLWVSETGNNRVQVVDNYGNFIQSIGIGQIRNIALAANGGFYATNSGTQVHAHTDCYQHAYRYQYGYCNSDFHPNPNRNSDAVQYAYVYQHTDLYIHAYGYRHTLGHLYANPYYDTPGRRLDFPDG